MNSASPSASEPFYKRGIKIGNTYAIVSISRSGTLCGGVPGVVLQNYDWLGSRLLLLCNYFEIYVNRGVNIAS